ncbi:uncharacterized protein LOC132192989 isoform X2 [Neocloeon triangulifer]|uniref:uncharacterized protein LOC132192989 isoform X2 n=1 Tax=Neocloeon triangulifer TaxID=2078957 RepID=UPI00286EBFC8|nr:uncharacterized protein LOC132192989 isoform X2 [Neocloeon triangulifer]
MFKFFSSSAKLFALTILLACPSVFAYGNRPTDFQGGGGGVKNSSPLKHKTYTAVNYWQKLSPHQLNEARTPSSSNLCFEPSYNSGLFTDCKPFQSQNFPSKESVCYCSQCNKISVKFVCYEANWYVHPDIYDFPCDNCNAQCPTQSNPKFKCEETKSGEIGETRSCVCLDDCRPYDLECSSGGQWIQLTNLDDHGKNISCYSQRKTVTEGDREMEYHDGLISVRCKPGFYVKGPSVVSCQNGQINSTLPECVRNNNNVFGSGVDQSIIFDNNNNNPFRPGFDPNNPDWNNNNNNPNWNNNNNNWNNNNNNPGFNPNRNPSPGNNPNLGTGDILEPDSRFTTPRNQPFGSTLLHLPNNNNKNVKPTSASVTSTKPVNRGFDYMYILYALLVILALLGLLLLVVCLKRCHRPEVEKLESGVAAEDGATKAGAKGVYAAKK